MAETKGLFQFTGQPMDKDLVANASSLLDSEGIPHVLWGNWLLTIFAIPTVVDGIAFVVDDQALERAYDIFQSMGLLACTRGKACEDSKEKERRFSPAPSAHLHISDDCSLMLFKKSEVLWRVPNLATVSSESTHKPDVILASDPKRLLGPDKLGRGGRFSSNLHPVRVPSGWRLVEAYILLLKRDFDSYDSYWMSHLTYMAEYVNNKDVLNMDDLEPDHKALFEALQTGSASPYDFL